MFITYVLKDFLLIFLQNSIRDLRINSVISSIILFAPVSIYLWIVSPYAVKLKIKNLETSWESVWNLYAISTLWSIFWTFISGFYLIPIMWTNNILVLLMLLLLIVSFFLSIKWLLYFRLFFLLIITSSFFFNHTIKELNAKNNFFDIDTSYNRVWIGEYTLNWEKIKKMWINNEWSSAMSLTWTWLVFDYTRFYDLLSYFNPDFQKTLMIWWAGYSYPKHYLEKYKWKKIDVVEIDPELTEIAKQHFNLKENENLKIIHEDGRAYLNTTKEKYDIILWDAFKSHYSLPYQLTTKEAIEKMYNILDSDWTVIVNVISAIEWDSWEFLRAEYKTYKEIFPQVFLFTVQKKDSPNLQNLVLVATKSNKNFDFKSENKKIQSYLDNLRTKKIDDDIAILTDDYAPVDYYISKTIGD